MREKFIPIDDALIERVFQPLADTISYRIGLDRLSAACFCTDIASMGWILSQARGLSDAVLGLDASSAFLRLLLLLLGLVALAGLRTVFRRLSRANRANPLRLIMRPHRAVLLVMLAARLVNPNVLSLSGMADVAMLGSAGVALYLAACAARPPERRACAVQQPA